jgi:dUTP pyrophosphatase
LQETTKETKTLDMLDFSNTDPLQIANDITDSTLLAELAENHANKINKDNEDNEDDENKDQLEKLKKPHCELKSIYRDMKEEVNNLLRNYKCIKEKLNTLLGNCKCKVPLVHYQLHPDSTILPNICKESNGLDLPLQDHVHFLPFELKKVNLGIKLQIPQNHCALLMNKSSARVKYFVNVQLGLIDVGYHDYVIAVIQNMTDKHMTLAQGIAVAQLLILPSIIPKFDNIWPLSHSNRGGFGSTDHTFEKINETT